MSWDGLALDRSPRPRRWLEPCIYRSDTKFRFRFRFHGKLNGGMGCRPGRHYTPLFRWDMDTFSFPVPHISMRHIMRTILCLHDQSHVGLGDRSSRTHNPLQPGNMVWPRKPRDNYRRFVLGFHGFVWRRLGYGRRNPNGNKCNNTSLYWRRLDPTARQSASILPDRRFQSQLCVLHYPHRWLGCRRFRVDHSFRWK